jgi:hypothetical protein
MTSFFFFFWYVIYMYRKRIQVLGGVVQRWRTVDIEEQVPAVDSVYGEGLCDCSCFGHLIATSQQAVFG